MKRIIYLFAVIALLSSCTLSDGTRTHDKDYVAKRSFRLVSEDIYNQLHVLSCAQTIELYEQATSDSARYAIEDKHLPSERLRKTETGWDVIRNGKPALSFGCDTPLNTPGSVWTVSVANYQEQITADQYWTIKCTAKNSWTIEKMVKYESHTITSTLYVKAMEELEDLRLSNGPIYKYEITGNSCFDQNEEVVAPYKIELDVKEPLILNAYHVYTSHRIVGIIEGVALMRVTDKSTGEFLVPPFRYFPRKLTVDPLIEYISTKLE